MSFRMVVIMKSLFGEGTTFVSNELRIVSWTASNVKQKRITAQMAH